MRHVLRVLALLCVLLHWSSVTYAASGKSAPSKVACTKKPTLRGCAKNTPKPKAPKVKKLPHKRVSTIAPSSGPRNAESSLTQKQSEMRDAFNECIRLVSPEVPTENVVRYVFEAQEARERESFASLLSALRGSTMHHGHEVCLVRAFGLKGFRNLREVEEAHDTLLVPVSSPYVDVVESEIPPSRRYARPWVRDYVLALGKDVHEHYLHNKASSNPFAPLRVTSIIRTFEDQSYTVARRLSPADCRYEFLCSSHTSGSGIDLGLKNVGLLDRLWLEERLIRDQRERKIYFIRENSHYHIFVLPLEYMGEE